jgi:hypothetical protein
MMSFTQKYPQGISKQVVVHCCLLPVIEFPQSSFRIEDFIPKSMKIKEIVKKVYDFKYGQKP